MRAIFPSIPRLCVCACQCVYCRGVCIADGGNKKGRWAPLPWGNSTVRCTLRSPAPTLIITFSGLNRIVSVSVCFFFVVKDEFRRHSEELWRPQNVDKWCSISHAAFDSCWIDFNSMLNPEDDCMFMVKSNLSQVETNTFVCTCCTVILFVTLHIVQKN